MDESSLALLATVTGAAREKGFAGIVLTKVGSLDKPYLAACLSNEGRICDPRNWDHHSTPQEAIADLQRLLQQKAR